MKQRFFRNLMLLFVVALLNPAFMTAEEQDGKPAGQKSGASTPALMPAHDSGGYISIGVSMNDLTGTPQKFAEYESLRQGVRPVGQIGLWGISRGVAWDLLGERGADPNDQRYEGRLDLRRFLRSEFRFNRLPHRLDNDPLTNIDAGKANVLVWHDNQDINISYCPYYQDMEIRNRLALPFLPQISFNLDYRSQGRKGTSQARAISKCGSCHISTVVRPMDQTINELRAGAEVHVGPAFLRYQYTDRSSKDEAPVLSYTYDRAIHPLTGVLAFYNRVQYDQLDGPIPIAVTPHFSKFQHEVSAKLDLKEMGELQGLFVNSRSNNDDMGIGTDTRVVSGIYTYSFRDLFLLTLRARNLDVDSDMWLVDVRETVSPPGTPLAGKTYSEAYPSFGNADYLATSSLAREVFTGSADARFSLPRKTIARFAYVYENVERPHFDVKESTTQKLKFAVNSSPYKDLKVRAGYTYTHTKDPFVHSNAAVAPALQPYVSPGTPPSPILGTQYWEVWAERQADLSAMPSRSHEFFAAATWSPADRAAVSFHLRADRQKNHDLNFSSWSDTDLSPSGEIWIAPHDRIDITAGYTYHRRRTETLFSIPVLDG
ncbi:MAG: MtrB/PioB family outer membrane beta-barrel protein [Acidobacteria bacterium]|nr:MtrB/PioB family outer membrane beta-barrel protein [Acidobacteriota bacterium]